METKTGQIRFVTTSTGKSNKGDWIRYMFEMTDGKKYSTFDGDIGKEFKPNDNVELSGEQEGKFWNMKSMKKIDKPEVVADSSNEVVDLLRQILAELKK